MTENNLPHLPHDSISSIGNLYHNVHGKCAKIFKEQDFPLAMDQVPVIAVLYYSGSISQQQICSALQRDKASVNRTISFLTKKEFVRVIRDNVDKRKTKIELTESGAKLAGQAHEVIEKFGTYLQSFLTEDERRQFKYLTKKLLDGVIAT